MMQSLQLLSYLAKNDQLVSALQSSESCLNSDTTFPAQTIKTDIYHLQQTKPSSILGGAPPKG